MFDKKIHFVSSDNKTAKEAKDNLVKRYNNYPARYVNGFIANDSNIEGSDTHAWVEIFIKDLGWVGFDPSHHTCVDQKYVRFSCGYDFSQSSMIKGVKSNFKGQETLSKEINIDLQTSQ